VFPSEWGTHQPVYFCFNPFYWFGGSLKTMSKAASSDSQDALMNDGNNSARNVEDVSDDLHQTLKDGKGIFIKDLRKTFQTTAGPKNAVDGLDLKMYHNQITCLLGHNGAGKTTTIGMLTGLIDATSGMASVDGKDVFTQMKEIRQDLGVCPQHDILYDRPACSTLPQPTSTHSLAPPQVPGPDRQGAPAPLLRLQGRSQQRDRGWHHQHGGAGRARGEGQ
jgi:hypothetical protein